VYGNIKGDHFSSFSTPKCHFWRLIRANHLKLQGGS
jgi:hypothetical protein